MYLKWLDRFKDYLSIDRSRVELNGVPEIEVIFDLEVLHDGLSRPTKLCLYHYDEVLERVNKPGGYQIVHTTCRGLFVARDVRSWSYLYDCPSSRLEEVCCYRGDFREKEYDWSGNRNLQLIGEKIPSNVSTRVLHLAKGIKSEIEARKSRAINTKERELYQAFLEGFARLK